MDNDESQLAIVAGWLSFLGMAKFMFSVVKGF